MQPNPLTPFPEKEGGTREPSSVLSPSPPGGGVGEGSSAEPNPPTPFPEKEGGEKPKPLPRNIVREQKVQPNKVARAKELRREMTPEERIVWECVRGNWLGFHFRRQQVIGGYIADFYCHAAGLVVELDGAVHDNQQEEDAHRTAVFEVMGIEVVRFRNSEVTRNLAGVSEQIARRCRERVEKKPNPPAPFPGKEGGEREPVSSLRPSLLRGGAASEASGEGLEPKKEAEERGEAFRP